MARQSASRETTAALNRFGLGARPGDAAAVAADVRSWLHAQLDPKGAAVRSRPETRDLPGSRDAARRFEEWAIERARDMRSNKQGEAKDGEQMFFVAFRDNFLAEVAGRSAVQIGTDAPFFERLVMFWSNHFAVSADKPQVAMLAGPFEREAIRPRVLGRFEDLLLAVEQHPAMLRFLDNSGSFGPSSEFANAPLRRRRRLSEKSGKALELGLNENLAREILELHTLGVGGGYTQADVIELAKAITGWTVETRLLRRGDAVGDFGFVWLEEAHEPGTRRVLGRDYPPQDGQAQGEAVLRDLARHPSTARFVSTKLARHFVADDPPPGLVAKLETTWLQSGGDLPQVYRALIAAPEAWAADARKFKRPEEFMISAMRAVGGPVPRDGKSWTATLALLGQPVLLPGSPAGWADTASEWIGPDGLWKRMQIAEELGEKLPVADPAVLADVALGANLRDTTFRAMERAESSQQAVAILFASPEFQWRS